MSKERNTFRLLWKMIDEIERADTYRGRPQTGTIISRYASMIDDRIENSGHSRSVDSLMLFDTDQLEEELERRRSEDE